jgi:DNA-binding XRE family transcriptional regulator
LQTAAIAFSPGVHEVAWRELCVKESRMAKKAPNPVDKHVGSRVRMRRMMLGMSQEKLGDALGLTFQQVQKYEKGSNRIGASRLQQISLTLQVPVAFFFEGAPPPPGKAFGMAEDASPEYMTSSLPAVMASIW